jgi:competence protein ComEC
MIFSLSLGFIGGIAFGSFFHLDIWTVIAGLLLSGAIFIYSYFLNDKVEERAKVILISVFLLGVAIGVGRLSFSDLYVTSKLDSFANKKITVEGIIVEEPDVRETNTKLTVEVSNIEGVEVKEKILITAPLYPEFSYGDKIRASLTLTKPKGILSEDGRVFDYEGYLRVRGIWYTSNFTKIELLSSGNSNFIKSALFKIKKKFTNALNQALPEPESSLMAGLLLGTKQSLGKELLAEFQKTGTSHVVVLSGYNIAIVATSIMAILKFLPKNISLAFGALGIILFTMASGGGASAVRAAIMVLVALFAKKLGRNYSAERALGFAIVLMLAPNPLLLIFDPSFQLSVLATIGIVFVSPIISPYFSKIPERFGLREVMSATIATQLTVLPFLIYNTGIFSTVSLPVNILILGTIPVTMFFGFLTGVFGLISLWLSFIPALPSYILLWYQLTVVHLGAITPLGALHLPAFSILFLIPIYAAVFTGLYFLQNKNHLNISR